MLPSPGLISLYDRCLRHRWCFVGEPLPPLANVAFASAALPSFWRAVTKIRTWRLTKNIIPIRGLCQCNSRFKTFPLSGSHGINPPIQCCFKMGDPFYHTLQNTNFPMNNAMNRTSFLGPNTCPDMSTFVHTHIQTYIYIYTYTCIYVYMFRIHFSEEYVHRRSCVHTYVYACISHKFTSR